MQLAQTLRCLISLWEETSAGTGRTSQLPGSKPTTFLSYEAAVPTSTSHVTIMRDTGLLRLRQHRVICQWAINASKMAFVHHE